MQIEGPPIAKIEYARLIPTFESMWRLTWKADVGGSFHFLPSAISGDVGE